MRRDAVNDLSPLPLQPGNTYPGFRISKRFTKCDTDGDLRVRFNDLTQTVLAVEDRTGHAAASLWRQCVDVLAQHDQPGKALLRQEERVALIARLHDLRNELTEAQRIASVVELGSRLRSPALVEFFASDRPSVCAAAIARARLPDLLWPILMSGLGPTARGVLRGRRDIGPETRRALEAFGPTDLVLGNKSGIVSNDLGTPQPIAVEEKIGIDLPTEDTDDVADAQAAAGGSDGEAARMDAAEGVSLHERSQIRQLVDKIERFTSTQRVRRPLGTENAEVALRPDSADLRTFPFETDVEGALVWVGEASRTALIGLSIAQPALPGETGPDGHVAGAFARRSSFQYGRLYIGEGLYQGEWRLSAVPFFDPASGRFQGYRGQARRPLVHEVPHQVRTDEVARQQPSLDSMRQIVHELRTPLNAILGFAEIIEQQLFGPAGVHYREMAGNILSDARRLLAAFDDIDLVARASAAQETPAQPSSLRAVDLDPLISRISERFNSGTEGGVAQSGLRIAHSANLPAAHVDPVQCERMIQHLTRTLVSLAENGENIQGALWFQPDGLGGRLILGFDRPARLKGLEEHEMLDPGYGSDGDWPDAPFLGLGFSLRLVRSLAQGLGGALRVEQERILLELPVADAMADNETG